MLVYERKSKNSIREVSDGVVKTVNWEQIPTEVPDWINKMVKHDNIEFVIDRQVFHTQYFKLV